MTWFFFPIKSTDTSGVLHFVRMMFGVSLIVPNINTERVKGILWHSRHEINMRSTRSPSTTSGDRGLDKRRTAEHLRIPLLFARDNPGYRTALSDYDSEYSDDVDGWKWLKPTLHKNYMAMKSTWNRTCFPNQPGCCMYRLPYEQVGPDIKGSRWVAFLLSVSWNWHLHTASGQRVLICLSCLFHTVVEIVTVNVCVWDNRSYAKHHPDKVY